MLDISTNDQRVVETETITDQLVNRGSRRWLGKVGIGMVALGAGLARNPTRAAVTYGGADQCCFLANYPSNNKSCPAGTLYSWTCCQQTRLYQCVECWDENPPPQFDDCDGDGEKNEADDRDAPDDCFFGCWFRSYVVDLSTGC